MYSNGIHLRMTGRDHLDRDTGQVKIDKYVTVHDSGTILNPLLKDGQTYGAFAWGVGCAYAPTSPQPSSA